MKFITVIKNVHGSKYDLYAGNGLVNLVPHRAKAPTSGYKSIPWIFQTKLCATPDPDKDQWLWICQSLEELL